MGTEMDDRIGGAGKAEGPGNWNDSLPSTSSARFLGTATAWKETAYPKSSNQSHRHIWGVRDGKSLGVDLEFSSLFSDIIAGCHW